MSPDFRRIRSGPGGAGRHAGPAAGPATRPPGGPRTNRAGFARPHPFR